MMDFLDILGYVIAALTIVILVVTLAAPLVRQRLLMARLRRDLETIDSTVLLWARDYRNR
ncbi:MAG TPA: hypothetical protein VM121_06120 [Acidimicrobiales bacterium]|nr:hypothetical protein [Acidimicrobiales bacterium]